MTEILVDLSQEDNIKLVGKINNTPVSGLNLRKRKSCSKLAAAIATVKYHQSEESDRPYNVCISEICSLTEEVEREYDVALFKEDSLSLAESVPSYIVRIVPTGEKRIWEANVRKK